MKIVSRLQTTKHKFYILPFVRLDWIVNASFSIYALQIGWLLWYWDLFTGKIKDKKVV